MSAIIIIRPGANTPESEAWAEMLLCMYLRWAQRHGLSATVNYRVNGKGVGIQCAIFNIGGGYSYDLLKDEAGVHRLVRVSPFDTKGRRHTSFASVFVSESEASPRRSYVLDPYQKVTDHRTGASFSDVNGVLDGNIEALLGLPPKIEDTLSHGEFLELVKGEEGL